MKRVGLLHSCLALLVLVSVFSFGLLVTTPKEVSAYADLKEGDCSQCHTDGRKPEGGGGAPAEPAKPADPAKPAEPAKPTDPAKPAEPTQPSQPSEPTQPTQPTPAAPSEPVESASQSEAQKVNNTLPIVGLAGSVIVIGGAAYLDRRKK